ncbi:MAG: AraC family transcriptional regulator [Bacteroidota bacterium]
MTHHFHIPSFPLSQFITCFVYYKGYTAVHSIDRFLPNGNVEIIINLTDESRYIYDSHTLAKTNEYKKLWISGIRERFINIPSGNGAEMFIIEFKKGMAQPFLGMPLTEITGRVVEGELVLNKVFSELRERLLEQDNPAAMFKLAEAMLHNQFQGKLSVNAFVDFAISCILANPAGTTIKNIAGKAGYSSKHLINIFSNHTGVSPKSFLRIMRFQKAIQDIETTGAISWVSLAHDCGYYDQAHLIANFKEFSGFTPLEYMQAKGGAWLNYVPVG